jgi:hypothetical protein
MEVKSLSQPRFAFTLCKLDYVKMSEIEFWKIADSFRDPRVWWIEDGEWWKDNVWGEPSSYGKVYLDLDKQEIYKNSQDLNR